MKVFGNYARYYDLLYQNKDYEAEADYVNVLIRKFAAGSKSLLDLGCGTGRHAICLAERGFNVLGVDLSAEMVTRAKQRKAQLTDRIAERVDFVVGDIRKLDLGREFDTAVSLFHVLSYQTTNEDLQTVFWVVREHLKEGGLFVFDFWYGPAVLAEKPQVRKKKLADEAIEVERVARPVMFPNDNCVEVNYELVIRDKLEGNVEKFRECHRMRYLFLPEIKEFLRTAGMKLVFSYGWMSEDEPGPDTWGSCCGATVAE